MSQSPCFTLPAPAASCWRFTPFGLLADGPDGQFLWGRWDQAFGHWRLGVDGPQVAVPAGALFDRLGRWPDPMGQHDDGWYAGRAARAAYFSLIPTALRRIAGLAADRQWEILVQEWRILRGLR